MSDSDRDSDRLEDLLGFDFREFAAAGVDGLRDHPVGSSFVHTRPIAKAWLDLKRAHPTAKMRMQDAMQQSIKVAMNVVNRMKRRGEQDRHGHNTKNKNDRRVFVTRPIAELAIRRLATIARVALWDDEMPPPPDELL
ncbi:MAG TPA: hypothetical protein VN917_02915, partial [Xanthobacteraceae bacterium]|nr:hypothetical protein [Xanthobacteraceae bacterium]